VTPHLNRHERPSGVRGRINLPRVVPEAATDKQLVMGKALGEIENARKQGKILSEAVMVIGRATPRSAGEGVLAREAPRQPTRP